VKSSAEVLSSTQVGRVAGSGEGWRGLESHTVKVVLLLGSIRLFLAVQGIGEDEGDEDIPASTSPPITNLLPPTEVSTTEQYCW